MFIASGELRMSKAEAWLRSKGFVFNEADQTWEIPGAADKKKSCVKKADVDTAEAGGGVEELIQNDVNLQQLVGYKGIDRHPRIREWTRKGKVE
jgi:hypothetical protein